ncbi:MAG: UDP-N-acetylglucosamine 1-carboxyvinyltransferase [Rickettsiales bacterium]
MTGQALRVEGGVKLEGDVYIGGAKNSVLPLLCATLLTEETCRLRNVPHLSDVATGVHLLSHLGASCTLSASSGSSGRYSDALKIRCDAITDLTAPYETVTKMRASFLVLGPLLARFGRAKVSMPGGCAIGLRPIDLHLAGLQALGADIHAEEGYIVAEAPGGLRGGDFTFSKVSVGATEHLMMAASLAEGETILRNAAREPEISQLADVLNAMGATVRGAGEETISITGAKKLRGFSCSVISDRIETGTFMVAAPITEGRLILHGAETSHNGALIALLEEMGVHFRDAGPGRTEVWGDVKNLRPASVTTHPYPGFPTDMQAQLMALASLTPGQSRICEDVFENRFMHVPEMLRMGADIVIEENKCAVITGAPFLYGADLKATDLRASVSLVLMAMAAHGVSHIHHLHHIDRGYERIEEKLRACGAKIDRVAT